MFDGRLSEFLLIAFIAIVVVGPKDLPRVMLKLGRWTRAAQRAAREFQTSLEQLAEEAEAKDVARDLRALGQETKDHLSGAKFTDYPRDQDPTGVPPPPLSVLPPEGGSFRPPAEEDEILPAAPVPAKSGGTN
jgi:sec-independent protein translocase protein TatB